MENISEIVQEINKSTISNKFDYFNTKYSNVFKKYPKLCKVACESDFDIQKFSYLMKIKDEVDSNTRTSYDADVHIGTILANEYIKK